MQYPPPGRGYGGPPGPGGYGGPPNPYAPYGGPPMPPANKGPNVAVIVLVVLAVLLALGGASCLVCVGLAGMQSTSDGSGTIAPERTTGTGSPPSGGARTIDRTPLAQKLEQALAGDRIPFDHVECPTSPPTTGTFSCAVLPSGVGDPAEVTVTIDARGMRYALQDGFVLLEGAKLASTFVGIAAKTGASRPTVPCFQGTIMKHVETSFSCEVMDGARTAGWVTTTVLSKSGDVKMDYEASKQR